MAKSPESSPRLRKKTLALATNENGRATMTLCRSPSVDMHWISRRGNMTKIETLSAPSDHSSILLEDITLVMPVSVI